MKKKDKFIHLAEHFKRKVFPAVPGDDGLSEEIRVTLITLQAKLGELSGLYADLYRDDDAWISRQELQRVVADLVGQLIWFCALEDVNLTGVLEMVARDSNIAIDIDP